MFGFFGTLLAGSMLLKEGATRSSQRSKNKNIAIANGEHIYSDGAGNWRSVDTDEIVCGGIDALNTYHFVYTGIKSGRIYYDVTQEKLDKMNENLKRMGKKYIWVEIPYTGNANKGRTRMKYDIERKMIYKMRDNTHYGVICDSFDKWEMHYYPNYEVTGNMRNIIIEEYKPGDKRYKDKLNYI